MRAVDRTTKMFVASVKDALPGITLRVEKSKNAAGRSNYVFIPRDGHVYAIKVRISDHPIGMRRANSGQEDLYIFAGSRPDSWAIWIGELRRRVGRSDVSK
jgi:hypothetical protein